MMKLIPPARRLTQQRSLQMSHILQSWEREIRVEISLKILLFSIMQLVLRYFEEAIRKIKNTSSIEISLGYRSIKNLYRHKVQHLITHLRSMLQNVYN